MANSPVDKNSKMMKEDFGTVVLITDPAADKYLAKAAEEKLPKFCGGAGGWDDYCERMSE